MGIFGQRNDWKKACSLYIYICFNLHKNIIILSTTYHGNRPTVIYNYTYKHQRPGVYARGKRFISSSKHSKETQWLNLKQPWRYSLLHNVKFILRRSMETSLPRNSTLLWSVFFRHSVSGIRYATRLIFNLMTCDDIQLTRVWSGEAWLVNSLHIGDQHSNAPWVNLSYTDLVTSIPI